MVEVLQWGEMQGKKRLANMVRESMLGVISEEGKERGERGNGS